MAPRAIEDDEALKALKHLILVMSGLALLVDDEEVSFIGEVLNVHTSKVEDAPALVLNVRPEDPLEVGPRESGLHDAVWEGGLDDGDRPDIDPRLLRVLEDEDL